MKERFLLLFAFILSIAVFFLHTKGLQHFYYWKYFWYPLLVHFLTGSAVAFLFIYLLISHDKSISSEHLAVTVISAVFFIALAWEVFEFVNGLTLSPEHYLFDTLKGITMGVLGSLVALTCSFSLLGRSFKRS